MSTTATKSQENSEQSISRDEAFNLLSNRRRRYALHAVKQTDGSVELSDIAEKVAAWENEKPHSDITSDERHRVYTSLQQTHLPTMDRAGVVNYDNGTVTLTEQAQDLDIYMDVVPENSIPWGEYYLGLAALSSALIATAWTGVFPDFIPDFLWGGIVAVVFLASSLYHVWQSRQFRLGADTSPPEVDQ